MVKVPYISATRYIRVIVITHSEHGFTFYGLCVYCHWKDFHARPLRLGSTNVQRIYTSVNAARGVTFSTVLHKQSLFDHTTAYLLFTTEIKKLASAGCKDLSENSVTCIR